MTSGYGRAMGLAVEIVTTTLVGGGLGWLLGNWLGAMPAFLLIGVLLGGAAGISRVFRTLWKKPQK